jgi:cytochrome P450
MTPAFEIDEARRSDTARKAGDLRAWDPANIGEFLPERWLKASEDQGLGETAEGEVFHSQAGPMMGFGIGHRACFGRKLVYLDMQIALTLLVWKFEFLMMDGLDTLEDIDSISRRPRDYYVKLKIIH